MMRTGLIALCCGAALLAQSGAELFEKRVRPVLAAKCQLCHNAKVSTAGVDLSSEAGFRKVSSRLLEVTGYEGRVKMPPGGKIAGRQSVLSYSNASFSSASA